MPVYTVHAPVAAGPDRDATDRFVFVRDGFYFWAFLFGPLWLAYRRLWLALAGFIVLAVAGITALVLLRTGGGTLLAVSILTALLMGLEAASLRRWTLSRRKWRQLDIVIADDEDTAERRFFDRWTARQRDLAIESWSVDRGGPPPTRDIPAQPFSRPLSGAHEDIIGLFPQPGASR